MGFVTDIQKNVGLRLWSPLAIPKSQSIIDPTITFQYPQVDGAQVINIGSNLNFRPFGLIDIVIGV